MEERQFNPDKTQDLGYVVDLLEKAIKENGFYLNKAKKSFSGFCSGYYYYDPNKTTKEYFVGLIHDGTEENHNLWIKKLNCPKKQDDSNLKYGKFYGNEDGVAWFCLKNEYFKDLVDDKKDFKQKFEIIKGFIKEVAQIK